MRRIGSIILAFCLFAPAAHASLSLSTAKKNFLYERDPKLLASSIQFVFRSGSLEDPKGKEGLAQTSFLALLRGTKNKERIKFLKELETLGASASVNTQSNRTIINLQVISSNIAPAIQLMAEAILQPGLRDKDIKQLISEEEAQLSQERSNNHALAKRTFEAFLMKNTPWAHPPQGNPKSIASISSSDISGFLTDHIKAGNLIVAIASNQPKARMKTLIEKAFHAIPEGQAPAIPQFKIPELPKGISLVLVPRKGAATVETYIGQPGVRASDPRLVALETGMFVLGGNFNSRMFTVLRRDHGWTYGAYASYTMVEVPRRAGGYFTIYTFPRKKFTHLAVPAAIKLFRDYLNKEITEKELRYAKNSLGNSYPFYFADPFTKLNRKLYHLLDGAPFPSVAKMRSTLKEITRKEIKKDANELHDPNRLLVVLVGDPDALNQTKAALKGVTSTVTVKDPMALNR